MERFSECHSTDPEMWPSKFMVHYIILADMSSEEQESCRHVVRIVDQQASNIVYDRVQRFHRSLQGYLEKNFNSGSDLLGRGGTTW